MKIYTTFGGLSGPSIKPVALANVHKFYELLGGNTSNIDIIGVGGVSVSL